MNPPIASRGDAGNELARTLGLWVSAVSPATATVLPHGPLALLRRGNYGRGRRGETSPMTRCLPFVPPPYRHPFPSQVIGPRAAPRQEEVPTRSPKSGCFRRGGCWSASPGCLSCRKSRVGQGWVWGTRHVP